MAYHRNWIPRLTYADSDSDSDGDMGARSSAPASQVSSSPLTASVSAAVAETKRVTASAVMDISSLRSKLQYLDDQDSLNKSLIEALTSVARDFLPWPLLPAAKGPEVDIGPPIEVQEVPYFCKVTSQYIGPTITHIIVQPRDEVFVHARAGDRAIVYSPRTSRIGWIPGEKLSGWVKLKSMVDTLQMTVTTGKDCKAYANGAIAWKGGERVRIVKLTDAQRTEGYGINLVTGSFGHFYGRSDLMAVKF